MSDYETTQRRRNITVGIFVVVALCALVWLIFMFNDLPAVVTSARSFQVYVQFPTAQGVQVDTPIQFCGYQIGRVTAIMPPAPRFDLTTGKTYHQTVCVLSIERKYKNIPSNVNVKVMTRGLGSSYVEMRIKPDSELKPLDPNRPETVYLVNGIKLQGSAGTASEILPPDLQDKFGELVDGLVSLVNNTNKIVGDPNTQENVKAAIANLRETSEHTAALVEQIQQFAISGTNTSEELAKTIAQLRLLTEKINSGEGTAGMFVNDGRFYENLLENTEQLRVLLEDLKNLVAEYRTKGIKVKL